MARSKAYIDLSIEEVDTFLDFTEDYEFDLCEKLATRTLEEYTLEEVLLENEMTEEEALAVLFFHGDIGLPTEIIEEIENEEVQDLQDTSEEDIGW